MEARIGGAWREITSAEAYVGGAWLRLKYAEAYINGSWRRIASFVIPMSAAASNVHGFIDSPPEYITTEPVTANVTGGAGPFTYAWSRVSGDTFTINTPTFASTSFSYYAEGFAAKTGVYRCTVTDSLGTVSTADMTVTFSA